MRIGRKPAVPAGATVLGALPAGAPMHVTVALLPRDPGGLAGYAEAVSTPGSGVYRDYLSPAQFAQRYGAAPAQVRAVQASLRAHGLRPGPVSPSSLSIPVTATAGQLERAFSLTFLRLALPGGKAAVASTAAPSFDAGVARSVQAVVGLSTLSAPRPLLVRPGRRPALSTALGSGLGAGPLASHPHVATGGPQPCGAAQSASSSQQAHTADQIASAYGFAGLYGAGDLGAGQTIAVYELEPNDSGDISAYAACYGIHPSISYIPVDGGAGSGAGSGEAALDIENLIGLAPGARLLVYQGPNMNSGAPGSGPYDTFSTIIDQDRAQVITVSWGQCEAAQGAGTADAENTLFEQAAVQGQSLIAAAGDEGSEDCNGGSGTPNSALAVDDPASQPFATGVGGTSLSQLGPRPTESVWNNGGGLVGALGGGAGGGGLSAFWPMPSYQLQAPSSLHVVQASSSGASCGNPGGLCREVPEVSADADPSTGYLIYWNGAGSAGFGQPTGWQGIGGTSGAAPVWAALIALANASRPCGGSAIGFADPALYRAAAGAYGNDFNDVASGNNDFTQTNGGKYAAGPGYDMASGLGTPNGAALAASMCPDTVRVTNPGGQRSTLRASISLRVRAADIRGATVSYHAIGLPPGLSIGGASGEVIGKPQRVGTFWVTITGQDAQGASGRAVFPWSVGQAPKTSRVSLTGLGSGRPRLSFTLTAGRGAPSIQTIRLSLPGGLRFGGTRHVTVSSPGVKRLRFTAALSHGTMVIRLRRAVGLVRVSVSFPSLHGSFGMLSRARKHNRRGVMLTLGMIDSDNGSSLLGVRLKPGR
ncbi:MAG: S8/S53 family peptidase [Solirubrobacterales bacterium]|nr:S8/S53 family peptidase [Solirubrobacterales bacterium]MBV9472350.1 S8/S53 family peptidase [Solirubrobacterales bacterium]